MTDIDPGANVAVTPIYDINQDQDGAYLSVRIPLAGHLEQHQLHSYRERARSKGITAHAEDQPDRTWIIIHVPYSSDPQSIWALLDDARALVTDADLPIGPLTMAEPDLVIRRWWSEQQK